MKDQGDLKSTERCPVCNSTNIEGEGVDVGYNGASQECSCSSCGSTWTLTFKLTGYEFLDERDVNGDRFDQDLDGPDREPSHGPDYWRDPETGEYRLG